MSHTSSSLKISTDIAKRLDITCRKGDTFKLTMEVTDANGAAVDFSAFLDLLIQVRPTDEDTSTPVLELVLADFDVSTIGTIVATKDAATMADVEAGMYVYDFQLTDQDGFVTTWFYGIFKINDDVAF